MTKVVVLTDTDDYKLPPAVEAAYNDTVTAAVASGVETAVEGMDDVAQAVADALAPLTAATVTTTAPGATQARSLSDRLGDTVLLDDFYVTADNGDWALTLARALTYANNAGRAVTLTRMYPVASPCTVPANSRIVGRGAATGLRSPQNAPVTILTATGVDNITLDNFTVDGNCLTLATKSYTRSIRFINCTNIVATRITTLYNPDWACSFEKCSYITVTSYTHRAGAATLTGGRDGIHFLDCTDFLLDGARIHSGDDCVGITSETVDIGRFTVRNVTGISEIAAVVTMGNEGTTAFACNGFTIENISTYKSADYASTASSYIVKVRAQNGSTVRDGTIANVHGKSLNYGVWLDGNSSATDSMAFITLSNIRVTASNQHGVMIKYVTHLEAHSVWGKANEVNFDGLHVQNSQTCNFHGGGSVASATWGLQLNACTNVDVWGMHCRDNGGSSFASSTGGNLRVVNCTTVNIYGGQYVGSATTSYYGVSQAGNTGYSASVVPPTFGGAH